MSGIVIIPSTGGGGGSATGSTDFFVAQVLDVRGKETNSTGDLTFSSSTSIITVSGNLNVLGSINAPISASAPTGSQNYFVNNQLDVKGYLTNSVGSALMVSGNMQVLGALTFNSSALATVTSFNTFSASVNSFTASQTATNSSTSTMLNSLGIFTASQTFTNSTTSTALASLNAVSASQKLFTASINAYTASVNAFTASINAYTASLTGIYDARYVLTASFTNTQVVSMVTGTLDTRYTGSGGGGSGLDPTIFNAYSASVNLFSASMLAWSASINTFTASQLATNTSTSTALAGLNTFSASVSTHTASMLAWSASINAFTASQATVNGVVTTHTSQIGSLNTFSASVSTHTASILAWSASVNTFTASVNSFTASADSRYVLTASFTNARVVSMVTASLDARYDPLGAGGGGGGGGSATFSGTILQISESAGTTTAVANYGQLFVNTGSHQLNFLDSSGTLSQLAGFDSRQFIIDEDFMTNTARVGANTSIGPYAFFTAGTAGGVTGSAFLSPMLNHPGVVSLGAGASATGFCMIYGPVTTGILQAGTYQEWQALVMIPSASTAGQRFLASVGTTNTAAGGAMSNGISIQYTDTTFAGNWYGNIGGLTLDLGVAMTAGAWTKLGVTFNAACTTASFYVNGNLALSYSVVANLPAAGDTYHLGAFVTKTAGSVSSYMHLDRLYFRALANR